ncbi:MAG: type II secretion system F family protein [Planctomycetes bacterium]|jgi:type IV pilus assembly protein PilC|nr:type II secretion system F family protein [Planctomycetota bacterium]
MPKYKYKIETSQGKVTSGVIKADTLTEASDWARSQGGQVLNISEAGGAADTIESLRNIRVEFGPGLKDIMYFTKQLAVMVRAGISLRDAIDGIASQVENQKFQSALQQIRRDVESGTPFSSALAKYPRMFGTLYINMVRASELSGTFADMMDRIAEYLAEQHETRSMIRGAMIYPAVLFTLSVTAVTFLLTWVLPKFMTVFKGKEASLPTPTKGLIWLSNFLRDDWYIPVAGIAILITGFCIFRRTPVGRTTIDRAKLKVPILSKMFRAIYISRGLQTMGELVNAGVPMLETLDITAEISGNVHYEHMWSEVRDSVQEGNKIVAPLQQGDLMPPSVVQMIGAGEESGRLGDVLRDVSEYYAKELKDTIKAVTSMLEPLMIIFMGFVIGFIAMSIILPIFKMSSIASGK